MNIYQHEFTTKILERLIVQLGRGDNLYTKTKTSHKLVWYLGYYDL